MDDVTVRSSAGMVRPSDLCRSRSNCRHQRSAALSAPKMKGQHPFSSAAVGSGSAKRRCSATTLQCGQGRGRTADLPIFSRPGPILAPHIVIRIKRLLDLRRLTRTSVNRQVRAEFRAGCSSARENESDMASGRGMALHQGAVRKRDDARHGRRGGSVVKTVKRHQPCLSRSALVRPC
jgi:hypothetical protein